MESYPHLFVSRYVDFSKNPSQYQIDDIRREYDASLKIIEETYAKNLPTLEENKAKRKKLIAFMEELGMPKKYSIPKPGSRARWPPYVDVDAGWVTDMYKQLPIDDGYEAVKQKWQIGLNDFNNKVHFYEQRREDDRKQEEREREQEKRNKANTITLIKLAMKYDVEEYVSEPADLIETLRQMDHRLDLAIAMRENRRDWTYGYDVVEDALVRFGNAKTRTNDPLDEEIYQDVYEACYEDGVEDGWRDIDGRVFRDCHWNYDRLFALVDEELYADYLTLDDMLN